MRTQQPMMQQQPVPMMMQQAIPYSNVMDITANAIPTIGFSGHGYREFMKMPRIIAQGGEVNGF